MQQKKKNKVEIFLRKNQNNVFVAYVIVMGINRGNFIVRTIHEHFDMVMKFLKNLADIEVQIYGKRKQTNIGTYRIHCQNSA